MSSRNYVLIGMSRRKDVTAFCLNILINETAKKAEGPTDVVPGVVRLFLFEGFDIM